MTSLPSKALHRGALALSCLGLAVAATMVAPAFGSSPGTHAKLVKPAGRPLVVPGTRYLALGDSVPFGYREANSIPAPDFSKAKNFIGFPEDVAANLGLKLTNAACPGETTASLINSKAQSNGCENMFVKGKKPTPPGYRSVYPLHVAYKGSQLAFAEKFLKQHPDTRLVTLMIGANDAFICQNKFKDGCVSEFSALLKKLAKNTSKIYRGLRQKAHYNGQIALVTYFSLDYSQNLLTGEVQAINSALVNAAKPFHVEVANGFQQFKLASRQGRGNPCTAQLLTALSGADKGTCGVHPSLSGAAVLAQAVERAVKK